MGAHAARMKASGATSLVLDRTAHESSPKKRKATAELLSERSSPVVRLHGLALETPSIRETPILARNLSPSPGRQRRLSPSPQRPELRERRGGACSSRPAQEHFIFDLDEEEEVARAAAPESLSSMSHWARSPSLSHDDDAPSSNASTPTPTTDGAARHVLRPSREDILHKDLPILASATARRGAAVFAPSRPLHLTSADTGAGPASPGLAVPPSPKQQVPSPLAARESLTARESQIASWFAEGDDPLGALLGLRNGYRAC